MGRSIGGLIMLKEVLQEIDNITKKTCSEISTAQDSIIGNAYISKAFKSLVAQEKRLVEESHKELTRSAIMTAKRDIQKSFTEFLCKQYEGS